MRRQSPPRARRPGGERLDRVWRGRRAWGTLRCVDQPTRIFLPGFAACAAMYARGLPPGWRAAQPPPPKQTQGSLAVLAGWALREISIQPGRTVLAGHSMGAALAILVAAAAPRQVESLLLIAPAGLPLTKPVRRSARDLLLQLAWRTHRLADVATSAEELVRAPRAATRLVRSLRRLDLTEQMRLIRARGTRVTVVACSTDTLVTPAQCHAASRLLGADYRQLDLDGGHVWMFRNPDVLATVLDEETAVGR